MIFKNLLTLGLLSTLVSFSGNTARNAQTCGGSVSHRIESIKPSRFNSMTQLYSDNRSKNIPNYITLDYVLTYYNLLEKEVMKDIERHVIMPDFQSLIDGLYKEELSRYKKADDNTKAWLKPLISYLSVIKKLKDPEFKPIKDVAAVVDSELALINAHKGIALSHVLWVKEDYSQYVPRGYYAEDKELSRYFLASLYASRMKFYFKDSHATGITPDIARYHTYIALEMANTINSNNQLKKTYENLNGYWTMFAGPPDDLTPLDITRFSGMDVDSAREAIWNWAKKNKKPRIISEYVDKRQLEPGLQAEDVVIGMRLIGQRILPDAALFQNLVYDKVTLYQGNENPFTLSIINQKKVRGFPRGFDLLAALGNWKARELLKRGDDDNYYNYKSQFNKARAELLNDLQSQQSWYAKDLMLVGLSSQNCPAERGVNTGLGFWIQSRHNYLLYGKQSYTVGEKGMHFGDRRNTAYLDPAGEVYDLIARHIREMQPYISDNTLKEKVVRFASVLDTFKIISENEKIGLPLAQSQILLLNNIDLEFKRMFGEDAPMVVDVHTEPENKLVLEEAVGAPFEATITINNVEFRGALYSTYEFKQRMDNRLDDTSWKNRMKNYTPLISF